MKRYLGISLACFCSVMLVAGAVWAKPVDQRYELVESYEEVDLVGDVDGTANVPSKALQDTVWIADWTFDDGSPCNDTGWVNSDNRAVVDASDHWSINSDFASLPKINNLAAVVGEHDLCWVFPDGYDNSWNTAICIEYTGDSFVSFGAAVDSEGGFDFLQVETDSACASFALGAASPGGSETAASFRTIVQQWSGFIDSICADSIPLSGFGTGDTHCAYISFFADGAFSPADGLQPTVLGIAAVVDDISVVGGTTASEDFEDGTIDAPFSFRNLQDGVAVGIWGRLFQGITDNDVCTEDPTCAWLHTDHITPTIANVTQMAFAPNSYVIKNWLDDIVHSPWVSLASTPGASGTVLSFRRFPGNFFGTSRAVQNWSVRGKSLVDNTDTPTAGDSLECLSSWGHAFQWNSLSFFGWVTSIFDMEADFEPTSSDIQVRFRMSDWQWIAGAGPPSPFEPGPGAFFDRVRIGRRILTGPVIDEGIDARYQGQDAFPTKDAVGLTNPPEMTPYQPMDPGTFDRFGTAAFSRGTELGTNNSTPNLITGDSITINVTDVRNAGGITGVDFYGCIVSGPHAGKAPPPHTVGGNGFFVVAADSARTTTGLVIDERWFVSLDDEYFLGGDVLRYFWLASDAGGGFTTNPVGGDGIPASLDEIQEETQGLFEVNFLPTVNWDPELQAAIDADAGGNGGKVAPELGTPTNPANWYDDNGGLPGSQKNCMLYYQGVVTRRRSGDVNRTTFMYMLDNLGYRGSYDVYDHTGFGNTNNHIGGRATTSQAVGYDLIIYDQGNRGPTGNILPTGADLDAEKIQMDVWFSTWLAEGANTPAGRGHTLWFAGASMVQERPTNTLYTSDMGVLFVSNNQNLNNNPDVEESADYAFWNGNTADYATDAETIDEFSVQGGCPTIRDYDDIAPQGGAVQTHTWKDPNSGILGGGAIVMNSNVPSKNSTIMQTIPIFDIRTEAGVGNSPDNRARDLIQKTLGAVLPLACQESEDPTDVPDDPTIDAPAPRFALDQNYPNPFNPMTTIKFDLARDGHVSLKIYDVAGRLVKTLVNEKRLAGNGQNVVWNGLDNDGRRVSSGVYFYRLVAGDRTATKKMVVAK